MELRSLRYFLAVVDAGSFNAASAAISISQPALTRQIHDLENDLGVTLLQRTSRGVRLTPPGATLYLAAQKIIAEANRARAALDGGRGAVGDVSVVLGASPTVARIIVPGVFSMCQRTVQSVRLSVREAFTPSLLDWLVKGLVDVAIVTKTDVPIDLPVTVRPLLSEPFALICPKSQSAPPVVHVSDLREVPLLMTVLHRRLVETEMAHIGAKLNVQAEIDSVDTIRELVLQGRGCTLMPISVFYSQPDELVTRSEIAGTQLQRQLLVVTRAEKEESAATFAVRDLITAESDRLLRSGIFSFRSTATH
ncbi:LysR family transcriptional regulator [Paraburkholderia largidicola]|uniref:LysR family transcriptional regulator n=1 Tax=Paraburkholderia largidicola TaxID=3014751 RepID=A0A7I8C1Y9_9BURK|nr:LysR family transcriptional regulator [Paraburkholderia sp. PGU16]BCF95052.1 LysR family transcriptional regulator [Paraburkholderia sp. PGU16]